MAKRLSDHQIALIELEELIQRRLEAEKDQNWELALKLETQYRLRKKSLLGKSTNFKFATYSVAYNVRKKAR